MNQLSQAIAIFVFSPIISLFLAASRIRGKHSKNILWLFCGFYGAAFYVDMNSGVDSVMYIRWLERMYESDINFRTLVGLFYREGERHYDIFEPLITFVVSRFTDNYQVFLGSIGLVYGFFFSRVVFFFVDRIQAGASALEWYLLAALAFSMDIGTGINSVRMCTAMFVFLYGALPYFESRRTANLVWAASSVLFHFSLVIPVAFLLIERYLNRAHLLVYISFLMSFIVAEVDIAIVRSLMGFLPMSMENRVGGYLIDADAAQRELARLISINRYMMKAFMIITMSYCYNAFIARNVNRYSSMPIFCMTIYSFANFGGSVGSIHRFYILGDIVAVGYLLLLVHWYGKSKPQLISVATVGGFLVTLQTALGLRFFLGFATTALVVGNPITVWFFEGLDSLYDYVPRVW